MNRILAIIIGLIIIVGFVFYLTRDDAPTGDVSETNEENETAQPTANEVVLADHREGGSTATVARAALTRPGYVVVYRVAADGSVEIIGTSALLNTGVHTNVSVELSEGIAIGDTIIAVLHADDGDGTFAETDDLALTTPDGFVTDVDVVGATGTEETEELEVNVEAYLETQAAAATEDDGIGDASSADVAEFTISGENYAFSEDTITVQQGQTVRITFVNEGGLHDFVIDEFDVQTEHLQTGEEETVEFVADEAGTFAFYCSVGQHRALGMEGTLVVEATE